MIDNYEIDTVIAVGPDPIFTRRIFQKWRKDAWYGLGYSEETWTLARIREVWPNRFSVIWSPGDDD